MRTIPVFFGVGAVVALGAGLLFGLTQCSTLQSQVGEPTPSKYGSYLAGRFASNERDASAAALYYDRALKFDPDNPDILERVLISEVADGDIDSAAAHAEQLTAKAPSARMPHLVIGIKAFRDGGYAKALDEFSKTTGNAAAEIASQLGKAYALLAEGKPDEALATATKLAAFEGVSAFAKYHAAIIADLAGKPSEAETNFKAAYTESRGESLRIVNAYAVFLERIGKRDEAKQVLARFADKSPTHPVVLAALEQAKSGAVPDRLIPSASSGLAEALYGIASSLSDEKSVEIPVFYLQLALTLDPRHELAISLLADRLETAKRWEDAIAVYRRIPKGSPLYVNARVQIAQNLQRLDRADEGLDVLRGTLSGGATDYEVLASMGDLMRGKENYAEAAKLYTRAIAPISKPEERHWTIYYTRGIALERTQRWSEAEKDLKYALKLKPEQPLVLNYLAYTWVEQGTHMDEALAMLQRAVELRPEDGFIIDSLGWAYYRRGDFANAIKFLERAVLLQPGEPTINDHLGDVYWRVGRKLEAKFEWQHALSLKPSKEDEPKIRRKIDVGLEEPPPGPAPATQARGGDGRQ
ncbi:MAG: tetratricopeptide repeat protein [Alphaproteobacteria bacterium]|nr:tetratricopeptide repeat protein [Alphaproteobacteria bacterium]